MSRYRTVTAEVEVELSDFDTDDLIEELESRGRDYNTTGVDADEMRLLLESIWQKRRLGNNDYQTELDKLIYGVLGHIV
jgi:hypothetical protein